jgi:hypothetical protein
MSASWRSIRLWLRRAMLTNISLTLWRSAAWSTATLTATRWTAVNASATLPISPRAPTSMGRVSASRSTASARCRRSTTLGSFRSATSLAACSSWTSGLIIERARKSARAKVSTTTIMSSSRLFSSCRSVATMIARLALTAWSPSCRATTRRASTRSPLASSHCSGNTFSLEA